VWYDSLAALSQIKNETERDALSMELFGKSAMDMAGIVDDGGAALQEYGQEAEDLGLILSQDSVDAANQFNDAMDQLKARTAQAFLEAGASLAETLVPALENLVEVITGVLQWFSDLDGGTQAFILTILGLVAAISPIAGIISTITGLAAALNVAMLPMIATVGGIVVGIGLLVAAGVALYQNWDTVKQKASELWQKITETFNNIKETVMQAVEKIKGAFNFSWSLPPLKLPHFHVSGGEPPWGLMGKGSLPKISIDWYKKAYQNAVTFSTPTILATAGGLKGFGDGAGGETVVGNALLAQLIRENSGASTLEHISALLEVIARDGTTVTLQGDARQMFKQVRRQNANFAKSTGKSGFDY
jgi:phage-related minor tail protein